MHPSRPSPRSQLRPSLAMSVVLLFAAFAPGCRCSADKPPRQPTEAAPAAPSAEPVADPPAAATPAVAAPAAATATKAEDPAAVAARALAIHRAPFEPWPPAGFADAGPLLNRCLADFRKRVGPLSQGPLDVYAPGRRTRLQLRYGDSTELEMLGAPVRAAWEPSRGCVRRIQVVGADTQAVPCEEQHFGGLGGELLLVLDAAHALVAEAPALRMLSVRYVENELVALTLRLTERRSTVRMHCDREGHVRELHSVASSTVTSLVFGRQVELTNGNLRFSLEPAKSGPTPVARVELEPLEAGKTGIADLEPARYRLLERLKVQGVGCFGPSFVDLELGADGAVAFRAAGCLLDAANPGPGPQPAASKAVLSPKDRPDQGISAKLSAGRWRVFIVGNDGRQVVLAAQPLAAD